MRELTNITRIDLEQNGPLGVILKFWEKGWQPGDAPLAADYAEGATLYAILPQLEKAGFTCEMAERTLGRALRGEITRIDFAQTATGWKVSKYPFGWTAKTRPLTCEEKPAFDLDAALAWCSANGWHIRRWPGGARAFKGSPQPVRDQAAILRLRRQTEDAFFRGKPDGRSAYDFAFDY